MELIAVIKRLAKTNTIIIISCAAQSQNLNLCCRKSGSSDRYSRYCMSSVSRYDSFLKDTADVRSFTQLVQQPWTWTLLYLLITKKLILISFYFAVVMSEVIKLSVQLSRNSTLEFTWSLAAIKLDFLKCPFNFRLQPQFYFAQSQKSFSFFFYSRTAIPHTYPVDWWFTNSSPLYQHYTAKEQTLSSCLRTNKRTRREYIKPLTTCTGFRFY